MHVLTCRIVGIVGVDKEEDREVDFFARHEKLLVEAKALDFVEVVSRIERLDIVGRDSDNGVVCGVSGGVEDESRFAGADLK